MSRPVLRLGLPVLMIAVAAFAVGTAWIWASNEAAYRHSAALLRAVQQLRPGISTESEVADLFHRHGGNEDCNTSNCEFVFEVMNHAVAGVPAQRVFFDIHAIVRNGLLESTILHAEVITHRFGQSLNRVADNFDVEPNRQPYCASLDYTNRGEPWRAFVRLNQAATASERAAAYDVRLNCFKLGEACENARQLLPTVWRYGSSTRRDCF